MSVRRRVAVVPLVGALLLAGGPPTQGVQRALPEEVTVKDGRSSGATVDISKVTAEASWYWDSEQTVWTTVPNGFQPGHELTVWFDLDGDSTPDGHYELTLGRPKRAGGKTLVKDQEFRVGGGWSHGGQRVSCTGSDGFAPEPADVTRDQRAIGIALDLWGCLRTPTPEGDDSGSWRVAVALAKNRDVDMAPTHRGWSPAVAGWGPCDPTGGDC